MNLGGHEAPVVERLVQLGGEETLRMKRAHVDVEHGDELAVVKLRLNGEVDLDRLSSPAEHATEPAQSIDVAWRTTRGVHEHEVAGRQALKRAIEAERVVRRLHGNPD